MSYPHEIPIAPAESITAACDNIITACSIALAKHEANAARGEKHFAVWFHSWYRCLSSTSSPCVLAQWTPLMSFTFVYLLKGSTKPVKAAAETSVKPIIASAPASRKATQTLSAIALSLTCPI